jgi:hypothetical protein
LAGDHGRAANRLCQAKASAYFNAMQNSRMPSSGGEGGASRPPDRMKLQRDFVRNFTILTTIKSTYYDSLSKALVKAHVIRVYRSVLSKFTTKSRAR